MSAISFHLPLAHEGILGKELAVPMVGTFRCVPGEVETRNGRDIQWPPRWERISDADTRGG